jgi:hypothetical protein
MDRKFAMKGAGQPIAYVRPVPAEDLPDDIRAQIAPDAPLYAVHDADGQRLAVVRDRRLAFVLARQNDLAPVSVH